MKTYTFSFSLLAAVGMFALLAPAAKGQVATGFNGSYSYDFSSMGTKSGSTVTLDPGWNVATPPSLTSSITWNSSVATWGTNGTSVNNGAWLFVSGTSVSGATGAVESLGGLNTGTAGGLSVMLALTNTTGASITNLNISFDLAQYWIGTAPESMTFGYTFDPATKFNNLTADPSFSFATLTSGTVPNQTSFSDTLTLSQPWANGTNLYLEWYLPQYTAGTPRPDVGIEGVSITSAVPEPSTFALLGGAFLLALPLLRRARRAVRA